MSDTARTNNARCADQALDALLTATLHRLDTTVQDRLSARGGVPELRDPDLALGRTLAAVHRGLGAVVAERLTDPAGPSLDEATEPLHTRFPFNLSFADRLAPVRIKYRSHALQTAQSYCLSDLLPALADARQTAEKVIKHLEIDATGTFGFQVDVSVDRLESLLEQVGHLAESRPSVSISVSGYLRAVHKSLEIHAVPLVRALHNAQQLVKEELAPMLADPSGAMDPEIITRDIADDLDQAWAKAKDLSRAVSVVQTASNDFTGDDLRQAKLEGALLTGVRWDAATAWPEDWEPRIRRASKPEGEKPGVLVIAAEPCSAGVSVDA